MSNWSLECYWFHYVLENYLTSCLQWLVSSFTTPLPSSLHEKTITDQLPNLRLCVNTWVCCNKLSLAWDREAWPAADHGIIKSWTRLSDSELNWTELEKWNIGALSVSKESCGHQAISYCSSALHPSTKVHPEGIQNGETKTLILDVLRCIWKEWFQWAQLLHLPLYRKALNSLTWDA